MRFDFANMFTATALAAVSVLGAGHATAQDFVGEFDFLGTETGINGTPEAFSFDTYTFNVTNNSNVTVNGFGIDSSDNIAFFGSFLQEGGDATREGVSLDADPLAGLFGLPVDALSDDTYFIAIGTVLTPGLVDSTSELSADFVGSDGFSIAPGETQTIAYFSVVQGSGAPTVGDGVAVLSGGSEVGRLVVVPEPTSLALVALGGVAMLARRRRA